MYHTDEIVIGIRPCKWSGAFPFRPFYHNQWG